MPVRCNLKGGFRLRLRTKDGIQKVKLAFGVNDIDSEVVAEGLKNIDPKLAAGLVKRKKNGAPADLELDVELVEDETGEDSETGGLNAADKIEIVKEADSLERLRKLAEGEERRTVLAAIEKRASELQDAE